MTLMMGHRLAGADNELLIAKYNSFAVWVGSRKGTFYCWHVITFALVFGLTYFKLSSQSTSILVRDNLSPSIT